MAVALLGLVAAPHAAAGDASFTIINADPPGIGFNDPTPASPIGGNPGVTLGEQRLIVVQYAAEIWAALLDSDVDIRIAASTFVGCPFGGFAAVGSMVRDFANAPLPSTWYPIALANKLAGIDLCPPGSCGSSDDMIVVLGRECGLYLGLDNMPPFGGGDLVRTALHEIGHGLGFTTPMDLATGAKLMGLDDVYIRNLEDHSTGKRYPEMTDGERVAGNVNTGNLHWIGANVVAASGILTSGADPNGHVEMYAPPTLQPGSSVYHFAVSLFPNQVLEAYSGTSADHDVGLALEVMRDLGWFVKPQACPSTPALGCQEGFAKGSLLIDERVSDREEVIARFLRGPAAVQADFGDPLVADGTRYDLCLYDDAPSLVGQLTVDRAGDTTCSGGARACWKAIGTSATHPGGTGYRFKDADAASDGVSRMLLKGGARSKVVVRGTGPVPPLVGGIASALGAAQSVTVQLRHDEPGCVSMTLSKIVKRESRRFKAK